MKGSTNKRWATTAKRLLGATLLYLSLLATVFAQQSSGTGQSSGQTNSSQGGPAQSGGSPGQSGSTTNAPGVGGPARTPAQGGQIGGPLPQRTIPNINIAQQVPGAARVTTGPTELSLEQAIQLAIQNNLTTLLAGERRREAEGLSQEARAGLLPHLSGTAYQANITQNLAALGFQPGTFPGITNTFIGPFNNFDARARLVQSIFNLSAIRNYQAGRAGVRVAELQEGLAREQVAAATALSYLESLRADRSVLAARANLELAQTLVNLAQDQRNAGVATGVDVTRAQTRVAQEQVRLAQAQTASDQALLNLQRIVGVPLGGVLTLTDQLRFTTDPLPSAEAAIQEAGQTRPEVRIAEEQLKVANLERRALKAELLPSLEFAGDYGVSGITPTDTALPTRRAAIQLNVPIFDGGLTRGRIKVAESRRRQVELELGSVRRQVEEDARLALATLKTAAQQVRAADESVILAQRELDMARDRFRAGVADNLEVVSAQTALANARDAQITSLAQYNAARLNLASALGRAEAFHW
jgi:outer membrane protein TolC